MRQQCLVQITHVQYTQHNGYVHAPTNKNNIVYKYMNLEKQNTCNTCTNIIQKWLRYS